MSSMNSDPAGLLMAIYNGFTGWTALLAFVIFLVAYDQCELLPAHAQIFLCRRRRRDC